MSFFGDKNKIDTRSKLSSSFLEEISCYLFKDLPKIKNSTYSIYNSGVYGGLKINSKDQIIVETKNVDFCVAKKIKIKIENQKPVIIIKPLVAVEVKTYLDATMFGEVKSSSQAIRNATPSAHTYILMGYKNIAPEHIFLAMNDTKINEIFVLRKDSESPFDKDVFIDYWYEISSVVAGADKEIKFSVPGRLLKPEYRRPTN